MWPCGCQFVCSILQYWCHLTQHLMPFRRYIIYLVNFVSKHWQFFGFALFRWCDVVQQCIARFELKFHLNSLSTFMCRKTKNLHPLWWKLNHSLYFWNVCDLLLQHCFMLIMWPHGHHVKDEFFPLSSSIKAIVSVYIYICVCVCYNHFLFHHPYHLISWSYLFSCSRSFHGTFWSLPSVSPLFTSGKPGLSI